LASSPDDGVESGPEHGADSVVPDGGTRPEADPDDEPSPQ